MIILARRKPPSRTLLSTRHHPPISQNPKYPLQSPKFLHQNLPFSSQPSKFPEYEMPSVTWGAIQGRKERLVSRVIISDYLKSLGIVPDELAAVELPSTVDVMKDRVEFLQKLGLRIDDINSYPLMLGCSLRKNIIPVLKQYTCKDQGPALVLMAHDHDGPGEPSALQQQQAFEAEEMQADAVCLM